jgi:hypothetical protein
MRRLQFPCWEFEDLMGIMVGMEVVRTGIGRKGWRSLSEDRGTAWWAAATEVGVVEGSGETAADESRPEGEACSK